MTPAPIVDEASRPAIRGHSFEFLTVDELRQRPGARWLVADLIPAKGLGVIYGESGSGKTFLVLDLVCSLAQGLRWAGKRTKGARVVYVGLEGTVQGRIEARLVRYDLEPADLRNLTVIDGGRLDLLGGDADAFIAATKDHLGDYHGPLVLVIDTLARTMPGGNENGSEDMGLVIDAASSITEGLGAFVLLVHHAGKDPTKGSRGWSGLKGALDVEIQTERNGASRTVTFSKVKEGLDQFSLSFRLEVVDLGPRSDVDPDAERDERRTSCVAVIEGEAVPEVKQRKLGDLQTSIVALLRRNAGPMLKADIAAALAPSDAVKGFPKSSVYNAIKRLCADGVCGEAANRVTLNEK
jgi:hypothetical protein